MTAPVLLGQDAGGIAMKAPTAIPASAGRTLSLGRSPQPQPPLGNLTGGEARSALLRPPGAGSERAGDCPPRAKGQAWRWGYAAVLALAAAASLIGAGNALAANSRRPPDAAEEGYWLRNMVCYHHFSIDEVMAATGFSAAEAQAKIRHYGLNPGAVPPRRDTDPLWVLPYPGGRHPRSGFLEGAIDPQRETKFSVFTPWDPAGYVVVDLPEAVFCNLGLAYLAHTHVPTLWTAKGIELPRLEWRRGQDGRLDSERTLPNGIGFGATVVPARDGVRMSLWLTNGTAQPLTGLRVQVCVMLKEAAGFAATTNGNKFFPPPYAAVHDLSGKRWIITGWEACRRVWGNANVPCLHSDPKLFDCAPGQTVRLSGWLSFYEGPDIQAELRRLDEISWNPSR